MIHLFFKKCESVRASDRPTNAGPNDVLTKYYKGQNLSLIINRCAIQYGPGSIHLLVAPICFLLKRVYQWIADSGKAMAS